MALRDEIEAGVEPLRVPKHGGRGTRKRALIPDGEPEQRAGGPVRPTGRMPGEPGPEAEDEQMREQEKAQFYQAETNLMKVMHDPDAQDRLLKAMNDPTRPVHETVGELSAQMLATLAEQMKAAGEEPAPNVLFEVGADVITPELFWIGEQAGIFPEMDEATEQEELGKALLAGMQAYGNRLLSSPDADRVVADAQQALAERVAQEADEGTLDPRFAAHVREQNPRVADQAAAAAAQQRPAGEQEG